MLIISSGNHISAPEMGLQPVSMLQPSDWQNQPMFTSWWPIRKQSKLQGVWPIRLWQIWRLSVALAFPSPWHPQSLLCEKWPWLPRLLYPWIISCNLFKRKWYLRYWKHHNAFLTEGLKSATILLVLQFSCCIVWRCNLVTSSQSILLDAFSSLTPTSCPLESPLIFVDASVLRKLTTDQWELICCGLCVAKIATLER